MWCLYVAGNMTKCPLTRVVRLREVSVSGGSTVFFVYIKSRKLVLRGRGGRGLSSKISL